MTTDIVSKFIVSTNDNVSVIVATEKKDCEHLLGEFSTDENYSFIVDSDTDFYTPATSLESNEPNERRIGFKFRKNFFLKEDQKNAYDGLIGAATPSDNRGLAAGNLQTGLTSSNRTKVTEEEFEILYFFNGLVASVFEIDLKEEVEKIKAKHSKIGKRFTKNVWLDGAVRSNAFVFSEYIESLYSMDICEIVKSTSIILDDYISLTTYANMANSGIAGWYDRYPRIPYGRATAYTANNKELFKKAYPFLQEVSSAFETLIPNRYSSQKKAISTIDPEFVVPGTVFTTLTVNKTFQTAFHRDAGDYSDGLSNLLVLTNGHSYSGGFLVLPEYEVAINIRPGDLLLINNHEVIHGNTPIILDSELSERCSLVCYLREGMLGLGTKEYETYRFNFVESRKNNKDHPLWRNGWNGISPGMWADREDTGSMYSEASDWREYLLSQTNGNLYLNKYHPWLGCVSNTTSTLDEFFN